MYRWTVDVDGGDWGGRTEGDKGIKEGLPIILESFKKHRIKGLFFVSTELLPRYYKDIDRIKEEGHEIGSHGHFHIRFKDRWRTDQDREVSETMLMLLKLRDSEQIRYRAPKFNRRVDGEVYSDPRNHVSILRHLWFNQKIKLDTIIYLHPFDLVKGVRPPNLFCRVWYSRWKEACDLFDRLTEHYPSSYIWKTSV